MKYRALTLAIILFCAGGEALAQAPNVQVAPVAHQIFLSTAGAPLVSGCVTTSISGSNTPLATYTDSTGLTQNQNPIILGSDGGADIWMTNTAYRFTVVAYDGIPGNKCAAGVTQYVRDGINPWNIINLSNNYFLTGNTSDPSGTAGEMTYRSDIPCFRFFTTFWDCVVRLTDTQTLTNKSLTSPTITGTVAGGAAYTSAAFTNPNINGVVVSGNPATYTSLGNDITNGTTLNTLTKMLGATAVIAGVADTGGIIGVTVAGAGKSGQATIQQNGAVQCLFDGSVTAGDYVQRSQSVGGDCHDVGATYPLSGGQVVGRVALTAAGAGTYTLILFGPELQPNLPTVVFSTIVPVSSGNLGPTTMATAPALSSRTYRFSIYGTQVGLGSACTGNTTIVVSVAWNDPAESGNAATTFFTFLITTNGSIGRLPLSATPPNVSLPFGGLLTAKQGTSVTYSTTYTLGSGCTTSPQYELFPMLEQMSP